MFTLDMKTLIRYAMEFNISNLETKTGYNGAPILRISSHKMDDLVLIQKWCEKLGFDNVLQQEASKARSIDNGDTTEFHLFCVFGEDTITSDVYGLK